MGTKHRMVGYRSHVTPNTPKKEIRLLFILTVLIFLVCMSCVESLFVPRIDNPNWTIDTIDSGNKTGLFSQLRLKSDGTPVIAYHSEEEGNLYLYKDGSTSKLELPNISDYGTFISMELDPTDNPIFSFHDYDYTYKTDLRALLNITDQEEQFQRFNEIMSNFLFGNNLMIYVGYINQAFPLDIAGGLYTSLELSSVGDVYIAYASYISEEFRDIDSMSAVFNPDDIEQPAGDDPLASEADFSPPFYPTFMAISSTTMQPMYENPVLIESMKGKDMGVSMALKAVTDSHLVCAYLNVTDFEIRFATSMDTGASWEASGVPLKDKVDDFLTINAVTLSDDTVRIGIAYYNITKQALGYVYTEDNGASWSSQLLIDDPPEKRVGWYPNLYYLEDGTALFSHYFSSSPRSLQYAELLPDGTIIQEQIDTQSCSNGRFNSLDYHPGTQEVWISYWDKCYNDDSYALKVAHKKRSE